MTDEKELSELIDKTRARGAKVFVTRCAQGYIETVQVIGARHIGPYPMGPIAAAEAMRRYTSKPR